MIVKRRVVGRTVLLFRQRRRPRPRWANITLDLVIDALIFNGSIVLAFLGRFDGQMPTDFQAYLRVAPLVTLVVAASLYASDVYDHLWEFAGLREAISLFQGTTIGSIVFGAIVFILHPGFPRSVVASSWLVSLFLLAVHHGIPRLSTTLRSGSHDIPRAIIVGAGEAGALVARELDRKGELKRVVGFVDDDAVKRDRRISGVPVLGPLARLPAIIPAHGIEDVIIAMPSANSDVIRSVVQTCVQQKVRFRTLPSLYELLAGSPLSLRDVQLEDLLARQETPSDLEELGSYLRNARVLISGGAGSIGSELCREVLKLGPVTLDVVDVDETGLFDLGTSLDAMRTTTKLTTHVCDVCDQVRLARILAEVRPDVVFHAAARKHVPMMERNPVEALRVNTFGTYTIARLAGEHCVQRFLLISTDKAVSPSSVMGGTKRLAEWVVQDLQNRYPTTRFMIVRFGNVLGSKGSVVPIFRRQIESGGPLTVTHPEMQRFFMTIREAVHLIICSGVIGQPGGVLLLDMGRPIRIIDLAETLIRLMGLTPGKDIKVEYTGVRAGEKLSETLVGDDETVEPTAHSSILAVTAPRPSVSVAAWIERLAPHLSGMDEEAARAAITVLIPSLAAGGALAEVAASGEELFSEDLGEAHF